MDTTTSAAERQVAEARAALSHEVDELTAAARSAVDIAAKVRRSPAKAASMVGGIAFLGLGGPRRLLGRARRVLRGGQDPAPKSVLPREIERLVADMGESGGAVRARLEREFADYLDDKRKGGRLAGSPAAALWRAAETFGTLAATNAARKLVERLFAADPERPETKPPAE
ncbi:MAG: hypothetical protein ACRDF7_10430 [Candidatus Limnocylindrales bacterium]